MCEWLIGISRGYESKTWIPFMLVASNYPFCILLFTLTCVLSVHGCVCVNMTDTSTCIYTHTYIGLCLYVNR